MNHPLEPHVVPACTRSPRDTDRPDVSRVFQGPFSSCSSRSSRLRSVLTVAAGLAMSAACGQGVSVAATERPLLVSTLTLPTHIAAIEVDNSHADSWLEIDRTANAQTGAG